MPINGKTDPNMKDIHGWTPLMLAVRENAFECVQLLLADPRVDPNTKNNKGDSALMHAAKHNKVEFFEILLTNPRVDVNTRDNYRRNKEEVKR